MISSKADYDDLSIAELEECRLLMEYEEIKAKAEERKARRARR